MKSARNLPRSSGFRRTAMPFEKAYLFVLSLLVDLLVRVALDP